MGTQLSLNHANQTWSEKADDHTCPAELRTCRLAALLTNLYSGGVRMGSSRIMRAVLRAILKLEGGEFYSSTARHLMSRWHDIDVGAYSYGCFDADRFPGGVSIGRYTSIARSVRSYRRNHPAQSLSMHPLFYAEEHFPERTKNAPLKTLEIGHDVWIGGHAVLLPGCRKIGTGAVIGAGAVVTRNVEPYSIVAGNPARVVGARFDDATVSRIQQSKWWLQTSPKLSTTIDALERELLTSEAMS